MSSVDGLDDYSNLKRRHPGSARLCFVSYCLVAVEKTNEKMSEREQIDHLANELDNLVDRLRTEYDMTYASVVGVLQMKIWLLCEEADERRGEL